MEVIVGEKLGENEHQYDSFSIRLIAYRCDYISATLELTDHDKYEWVNRDDLSNYHLAESDIHFIKSIIKTR